MTTPARLQKLIEPIVAGLGLELFDLHYTGSVLTVLVDRPVAPADGTEPGTRGPRPGVDMEALTAATRAVYRALDEADPIAGHYSLEVSSPGLERPLRTQAHFEGALGQLVSVKTVPDHDGPRRLRGELVAVDEGEGGATTIDVRDADGGECHRVPLAEIERARTVFEWGPEPKQKKPKPSKTGRRKGGGGSAGRSAARREDPPTIDAEDKKVSAT